jgi:hypothetical protein
MQSQITTGSSETIRKTAFNFSNYKEKLVSHKKSGKIDPAFLEWFVGFSEGDASFIVSKGRLFFIINQKEEKVLHRIRTELGFGKVSNYKRWSRFIVADRDNIERLIHLFNGNLVLHKTNIRFRLWLQDWNLSCCQSLQQHDVGERQSQPHRSRCDKIGICPPLGAHRDERRVTPLPQNKLPSFENNGWLSGLTDADGCFNAVQIKDSRHSLGWRLRLRFILDQKSEKDLLERVKTFLGSGVISRRQEVDDMWRLTCTSIPSHQVGINYFSRYPLRTIKRVSFLRFASLLRYITKRSVLPWEGKVLKRVENLIKKSSSQPI